MLFLPDLEPMADNTNLPSSIEEVVALIAALYRPGANGSDIAKTQETLHKLQKSPNGWRLASTLHTHQQEEVRFFAALTFTVKLNTDAKSLTEEDANGLLQTLIGWLLQHDSEQDYVKRKICSTLVAYFFQFPSSWNRCVKHLMCCLCANEVLPYDMLGDTPDSDVLVQNMPSAQAILVFWFASNLVEEVAKTDSSSMNQNKFHEQVKPNVDDIASLMSKYIREVSLSVPIKVRQEAMKCYQSWVSYSHRAFIDDGTILEPLRSLTQPALRRIVEDDLYDTTVELFTEVLSNYSTFLHKNDYDALHALFNSEWAQQRYRQLIKGDFEFDSLQFGMFMIAFGDATVQELTHNVEKPQCQQYLSALIGLLGAEGYAVADDKIYVPALEFWNSFVETMVDELYTNEVSQPAWFLGAQSQVLQVVGKCWLKSQFPPSSYFKSWDSVERTGFKDARRDFQDMLQSFYLVTGIPILQLFIDLIPQSVTSKNWSELEASLYCLGAFSDCVHDHDERDEYLDKIFSPELLTLFSTSSVDIPNRTMLSFLECLVKGYSDYFKNRTQTLPVILNVVFEAANSPALAKTASETIMHLCSDCRTILVPELGAFLQHYGTIASNSTLDGEIKARIVEGITAIIQALPDDTSKIIPLEQLLSHIEQDISQCMSLIPAQHGSSSVHANDPVVMELGLQALRCLEGMAKGIQMPDERPVDLDSDDSENLFWTSGAGFNVQQRIYSIMNQLYNVLGNNGEIIDELCKVWRQGFREIEPGPFVMPPNMAATFLMKANLQTPRLVHVLTAAGFLVTSQKWGSALEDVLGSLLNWVSQLLQGLGEPAEDPEIAQTSIEFLHRLLPKAPQILLSHQPSSSLEYLFVFILKALAGTEPLPKGAAAEFWTTFLTISSTSSDLQASIDAAMAHFGPLLAQALIYNIGGHAARSELDKLSDPIKKLTVRQVNARSWLESALLAQSFPSDKVGVEEKRQFLQKVMNLRGARGTNQVVRDFWLACRGSNFAYAS